jgi:hypothetical protein
MCHGTHSQYLDRHGSEEHRRLGLIAVAAVAVAATVDFACPMFQSRNRNWRLKLLFSKTQESYASFH